MEKRGIIKITSRRDREYNTKLSHEGNEYFIITDREDKDNSVIKTSVYKKGKHIKSITQRVLDKDADIDELMNKQHQSVVDKIKKNVFFVEAKETIFREINRLIRQGKLDDAAEVTQQALNELPDDPMLNSYYGYLIAEKGYTDEAIRYCKKAIKKATRS
ncbi:MAG: tetratricopeptide repeat protein, partial [Nitrospirae bacterium]